MDWQRHVAGWIASEEASLSKKHLVAQNCCNFVYPVKSILPGVGVVNFHYAYPEAAALNYGLGVALSYDETGFLGREDDKYARQAWNFTLSGGGVFDSLDYSFSVGHEDGKDTEANGPGGGSAELRKRLRILSEFLNGLPLVEMHPDFSAVKHGAGVVPHVLSSAKGVYAIYLDGKGPTEVTFSLPAGDYSISWVDIITGEAKDGGRIRGGGDRVAKSPIFADGIAIRLVKK
jgi:hypothetical protein